MSDQLTPLPQQIRHLFGSGLHVQWDDLPPEARAYWEHQADAVRRAVGTEQPAAPALSDDERKFLSFALDEAAEEMYLRDGFTDADRAALAALRKIADGGKA